MRVVAVIPAYNCEKTVGKVIKGLNNFVNAVIVVDDGSTDKTSEIAKASGAKVVRHSSNSGLGSALRTGFQKALSDNFDIIVTLDADGQHSPDDVKKIIERLVNNHCETVIGSRLTDKSQWDKFPPMRLFGNLLLTFLTNLAIGKKITTDSQSGYRGFLKEVLEAIHLESTHMAISSEIIIEVAKANFSIAEVEIKATYEEEVSYQRFFKDPLTITGLLIKKLLLRFRRKKYKQRTNLSNQSEVVTPNPTDKEKEIT
jgi:glycosyltransferase involved in cell wall biosynthesis